MRPYNDFPVREHTRGDTLSIDKQIIQRQGTVDSIPDITDFTFTYTVKYTAEDEDFIIQSTLSDGISIVDGPNGQVNILVSGTQTADLRLHDYYSDLQMEGTDIGIQTVAKEILRITTDITR